MTPHYFCPICHNEIPHPGAECAHCESQRSHAVGATPQLLVAIFAVMIAFFVITGFLTRSFRHERRVRAQHHYQRAQTLLDYGYYDEAIEQYRDALSYAPDNTDFRLGLAKSLYYSGQFSEAENYLVEFRASDPTLAVVNRLLALISSRNDRLEAAENYYRTAIYGRWERNPEENRMKVRFELVELLQAQGKNLQAVGELVELLREVPDDIEVKQRIAWLFLEADSPGHAAEVFKELLKLDSQDFRSHLGLGEAEFAIGHFYSARSAFQQALSLRPDDEHAKSRLELCNEIRALDPTHPPIGTGERLRRSRLLVKRSLDLIEYCLNPLAGPDFVGPPAPPPDEIAATVDTSRAVLSSRRARRAREDAIERNINLAQSLWAARPEQCGDVERTDEALGHVLLKLSR